MSLNSPPISEARQSASLDSWEELKDSQDIQFAPLELPEQEPREPGWLERFLNSLFESLGELIGGPLAGAWPVLKWILLALLIAAVGYMLWQLFDPLAAKRKLAEESATSETEWRPDQSAAMALLEDADRLAQEGRFDEATHLLLQRSVSQIATARPEWVEPSSTARELARMETLPVSARNAFGTIAEQVELSLFALRALERSDWESARAAYAAFAQVNLSGQTG